MEFSEETIDFLSKASAISVQPDEREQLKEDLKKIFIHIESLKEVPTENIRPCSHPLEIVNVVRDDVTGTCLSRQTFMDNCPAHIAGMVRVPTILQKD
jgi:aspartyl-tRNA(Asn)/glutamyl-tRNA(Gln) amidotransferase subunit C